MDEVSGEAQLKELSEGLSMALGSGRVVLLEAPRWIGPDILRNALESVIQSGRKVVLSASDPARATRIVQGWNVRAVMLEGRRISCPRGHNQDECEVLRDNTVDYVGAIEMANRLDDEARELEERYSVTPDLSTLALRDRARAEYEAAAARAESLARQVCEQYYRSLKDEADWFSKWLFEEVRSPREIRETALERGMCGFELMKENMASADMVICGHHHLLNLDVLHLLLNWLDVGLSDVVLFVDEAHKLENAALRPAYLYEYDVSRALSEAKEHGASKRTKDFLEGLGEAIRDTYLSKFAFGEKERLGPTWQEIPFQVEEVFGRLPEKNHDVFHEIYDLGERLLEQEKEQYRLGQRDRIRRTYLLPVASFLASMTDSDGYHWSLRVRRTQKGDVEGRLELAPATPRHMTKALLTAVNAAILASPVLRPFDALRTTLGIHRNVCEILVEEDPQALTVATISPPLFSRDRDDPNSIEHVRKILEDCIRESPGRIMALFPSITEARRYHDLIPGTALYDPSDQPIEDEPVVFSYFWGPFIDQVEEDEYDVVAIVGVPYPSLGSHLRSVQAAYDSDLGVGSGWQMAVITPTIRRVREAMGLVTSGTQILVDARYTQESVGTMSRYSVYEAFPRDIRRRIVDVEPDKLRYSLRNHFEK